MLIAASQHSCHWIADRRLTLQLCNVQIVVMEKLDLSGNTHASAEPICQEVYTVAHHKGSFQIESLYLFVL